MNLGELQARLVAGASWILARDWLVLGGLVALAAALRLPGLDVRGRFDGDQGHDMLTLLQLTRDGVVPLLGPQASVGEFHHGAFYYYLLAPAAWLSGANPTAVVAEIALLGIAAVALTWWLGRLLGGRVVALVAGLLLALSPSAIEESTFIWNPNPIPFFAALALAAAWRGHQTGRARWWAAAVGSAAAVVQLHVLGLVFVPAVLALLVRDLWQARRAGDSARGGTILRGLVGGLAIAGLLFVPLIVHELETNFLETRRIAAYLASGGGDAVTFSPLLRLVITAFRVIDWPIVGLVTDVPAAASLALAVVLGLITWRAVTARGEEALPIRWLAATIAWSAFALTFAAPSLQTIVPGLPNDHYHAFLDPVVVLAVALAAVAVARRGASAAGEVRLPSQRAAARAVATLVVAVIVGLQLARQPPPDPNGGWAAANTAGQRLVADASDRPVLISGLPAFKSTDGTGFPVIRNGGQITATPTTPGVVVVVCDRLFEEVMGIGCGGPAEDREIGRLDATSGGHLDPNLVERFDQSPRISISVYAIATPAPLDSN